MKNLIVELWFVQWAFGYDSRIVIVIPECILRGSQARISGFYPDFVLEKELIKQWDYLTSILKSQYLRWNMIKIRLIGDNLTISFSPFQLSSNRPSSFSITCSSIFLTQILIFCARQNVIIMSKQKLKVQDLKRVLYWFHLAFKEKSPSKEDGESLKMILSFAQCEIDLIQDVDENDEWDKRY